MGTPKLWNAGRALNLVMAPRNTVLRVVSRVKVTEPSCPRFGVPRNFSTTCNRKTDGVFRALTDQRVQTPWVEAFRKKQREGMPKPSGQPETPKDRDLAPKKMTDSYHSVVRSLWRMGTIFMDLDALSGVIAYKHTGESVTTVTAAFDRITINNPLNEICDLELSGHVTYTGRSSMEITLQVAKAPQEGKKVNKDDVMITCTCTMVSLDPGTRKPVAIPPVRADTDEEKNLFVTGEKNSKHRKSLAQRSLLKTAPNDEESDLIHNMWQRQLQYHDPNDSLRKPDNVFFMDATKTSTAAIMQPQYRNRHHFMIFGGFLLKQTFELAFCCAASFAHTRPTFVSLDPSTFQNPVPVGSVLYLTATVVYTDPPLVQDGLHEARQATNQTRVQVRVDSKVRNVEHGETKPTGQFNYTFTVDKDIKVMPRTYSEFMMYVDARRRVGGVLESVKQGANDSGKAERVTE
nr:isoform 3 of acyl-coenzyme a thioesterase 9, mitochondrial [Quercus suber]